VEGEGEVGPAGDVCGEGGSEVEVEVDVAVEDKEAVVDAGSVDGVADGAAGFEPGGFDNGQEFERAAWAGGVAAGEVFVGEAEGEDGAPDAGARQPVEEVLDGGPVADGHEALMTPRGEGAEARPLSADEQDGVHAG
jgi:hypothetical protein